MIVSGLKLHLPYSFIFSLSLSHLILWSQGFCACTFWLLSALTWRTDIYHQPPSGLPPHSFIFHFLFSPSLPLSFFMIQRKSILPASTFQQQLINSVGVKVGWSLLQSQVLAVSVWAAAAFWLAECNIDLCITDRRQRLCLSPRLVVLPGKS